MRCGMSFGCRNIESNFKCMRDPGRQSSVGFGWIIRSGFNGTMPVINTIAIFGGSGEVVALGEEALEWVADHEALAGLGHGGDFG